MLVASYLLHNVVIRSSIEREALAIVWATKHFPQYLEGGPVIVRSDCKALEWLKTARDPKSVVLLVGL